MGSGFEEPFLVPQKERATQEKIRVALLVKNKMEVVLGVAKIKYLISFIIKKHTCN